MREHIAAFTASVLINVAAFSTVERAASHYGDALRLEQQKKEARPAPGNQTSFDFIEAPPGASTHKPLKETSRISDRDAIAQDLTPDKKDISRQAPPKIEAKGRADQLEQKRFVPSQAPLAPLAPSPAVPPVPAVEKPASSSSRTAKEPGEGPDAQRPVAPPQETRTELSAEERQARMPSPAQAPAAPRQGLAGADKISTPAVSRSRSHGAQVYGRTSFEATGSGMGRYMKDMKERIWLTWFPYLAIHYPKDFRSASATIGFTIAADGRLLDVRVVAGEGGEIFAAFCVEAIQKASPFGPLPAEILDLTNRDDLDAQFVFNFW